LFRRKETKQAGRRRLAEQFPANYFARDRLKKILNKLRINFVSETHKVYSQKKSY
jgi:hypothetical protein